MKSPKYGGKNKCSEIDSLMPLIPKVSPPVGKAREKFNLPLYLKRQGNGRSVDDKEEKINEHGLAFGAGVAIEKHQERCKRMNNEQSSAQDQTVFYGVIHYGSLLGRTLDYLVLHRIPRILGCWIRPKENPARIAS
jgi:hypothetical protein